MSTENDQEKTEVISLVGFALELGYSIALPLVICTLVGKYIDNQLGTSPLFLLIGMVCAAVVSVFFVYRKVKYILKDVSKKSKL